MKKYKSEAEYQSDLIKSISNRLPNAIIMKLDSAYIQGIPDLEVINERKVAFLEVKKKEDASHRPNQDYYVNTLKKNGHFSSFIYPENESEVLDKMYSFFEK